MYVSNAYHLDVLMQWTTARRAQTCETLSGGIMVGYLCRFSIQMMERLMQSGTKQRMARLSASRRPQAKRYLRGQLGCSDR